MEKTIKTVLAVIILTAIVFVSFNNLDDYDAANYCEGNNSCIMNLVKESQNPNICDNSNKKNECYLTTALYFEEPNNCFKTNNTERCLFDYAVNSNQPDACEYGENVTFCYYSYAIAKDNSTLCNITGEFEEMCQKRLIKE